MISVPSLALASLSLPLLDDLVLLLLGAMLVALVTRRLRIPYTVGLVVAGAAIGFLRHQGALPSGAGHFELTEELILLILLPPLLFDGAMNTPFSKLKENGTLIATMALLGTLGCILLTTAAIRSLTSWDWDLSLLLGAIVSPTDPVSVLAIFREQGVEKRLSTIVEGESLFNDGLVVVLYLILMRGLEQGWQDITVGEGILTFIHMIGVGALVGLSLGSLVNWLIERIDEHLIEVLFSILLAYGSYMLAERFEASGVIAVVFAGLMVGNVGRKTALSATAILSLGLTWEVIAFIANSIAFIALGFAVDPVLVVDNFLLVLLVWLAATAARALMTYAICGTDQAVRGAFPRSWLHIIHWGGLKGTVPVALALGVAGSTALVEVAPRIQAIVAGVVMLSMLIQGTSLKWLLRKLKIVRPLVARRRWERHQARSIAVETAIEELADAVSSTEIDPQRIQSLRDRLLSIRETIREDLKQVLEDHPEFAAEQVRDVVVRLLHRQRAAVEDAYREGILSDEALQDVQAEIDQLLLEEFPDPVPGGRDDRVSS
ncbi:MAG: cation:proton antiporter [Planctomycetota bacterium]|nr:cation:proton antiporter [Planctomycetota bacterium]